MVRAASKIEKNQAKEAKKYHKKGELAPWEVRHQSEPSQIQTVLASRSASTQSTDNVSEPADNGGGTSLVKVGPQDVAVVVPPRTAAKRSSMDATTEANLLRLRRAELEIMTLPPKVAPPRKKSFDIVWIGGSRWSSLALRATCFRPHNLDAQVPVHIW